MTPLGLTCLLENIVDEQPNLVNKHIKTINVMKIKGKDYIKIIFVDDSVITRKLYEDWSPYEQI